VLNKIEIGIILRLRISSFIWSTKDCDWWKSYFRSVINFEDFDIKSEMSVPTPSPSWDSLSPLSTSIDNNLKVSCMIFKFVCMRFISLIRSFVLERSNTISPMSFMRLSSRDIWILIVSPMGDFVSTGEGCGIVFFIWVSTAMAVWLGSLLISCRVNVMVSRGVVTVSSWGDGSSTRWEGMAMGAVFS